MYQCLGAIADLVTYIYDNTDPLNPHYTTVANTGVEVADNTAVPCVQNTTTIYVVGNGYFRYKNQADANIDFTSEDLETPTHFDSVDIATDPLRHDIEYPDNSLFWFDKGYINELKMLDSSLGSQTVADGNITLSFEPDRIDTIAFMNIKNITSIDVTVTSISTSTVVYDESIEISTRSVFNWYEYFFAPFAYKRNVILAVPISSDYKIDITMYGNTTETSIGLLAVGRSEYFGGTKYGARIGAVDYSKKEVNSKGEWYMQEGKFSRTNDLQIEVVNGSVSNLVDRLDDLRATLCIYSGDDDISALQVYGIYKNYDLLINTPTRSVLNIEIESIT